MSDLERGIANLRRKLAEEQMSPATRDTVSFALRSMEVEKERRERSPQTFYKDHG